MPFSDTRYETMVYRRCGKSGLMLPAISLGMWHNFGTDADHDACREMMTTAFDLGITHFDLANNYGPKPGAAEERVGRILGEDFAGHRDELVISSKAGFDMWTGPYGEWGSKKYLVASLDQSLKRLGLDYVDVFYHHRPDPDTPLEETLGALELIVQQGKALYAGVSNYGAVRLAEAEETIKRRAWHPITIYQPNYSLFNRGIEHEILDVCDRHGTGVICFGPLHQGILTNKYVDPGNRIPKESRAADPDGFLSEDQVTDRKIDKVRQLSEIAADRGQTMAQMALAWVLRDRRITSALIGARNAGQVKDCAGAVSNLDFCEEELAHMDTICPL